MCHERPPNSPQTDNPRNNLIFLDVQKAYDKAWLDAIMYALLRNGVEGKNLRMIKKLNSTLLREYKRDTASQEESTLKIASDKEYYQS